MSDAQTLIELIRDNPRNELWKEDPYISEPKEDGYRSHHLRYKFKARKAAAAVHDGRRIEVQIRTKMQNAWATAVEAVGFFLGQNLKGNEGDPDWLRLFLLISAEFAEAEGCAEPPGVPSRRERRNEIKELDRKLNAVDVVQAVSYGVRWYDLSVHASTKPQYYLITTDAKSKEVRVEPYFGARKAVQVYDSAEEISNFSGEESTNIVLVEADKIETLREAYPNYFFNVQTFVRELGNILDGKAAGEFTLIPQETVRVPPPERPDYSWLTRAYRRWK